jgi:hypothetical protein
MNVIVPAAVFALVFVVRWITIGGLGADDHWSLWTATTFLKGDLPLRDFTDAGAPLYWAVSALGQWIFGYRVVGEVLVGSTLVASALTICFLLSWRASGSLVVAALLSALVVLLVSAGELYSYPKTFVYPIGIWLSWRYIDRPSLTRAVVLALGVLVAFGYRHDHGAYVGVGAAAAVLAAHWHSGPRATALGLARFCAGGNAVFIPVQLFGQMGGGVVV